MRREHWLTLLALAVIACATRGGLIAVRSAELTQDRDAYLGLAEGLRSGRGYSSPGAYTPTAYRPPLYPLVLAASPTANVGQWVAAVNLLSGVATVCLTFALALRLGLPQLGACAAAALVAIDPLLVRYASQPMTESLCTLLVTGWVWRLLRCENCCTPANAWWVGVWLGLCALCRPTVWPAAGLIAVWTVWRSRCCPAPPAVATPAAVLDAPAGECANGRGNALGPLAPSHSTIAGSVSKATVGHGLEGAVREVSSAAYAAECSRTGRRLNVWVASVLGCAVVVLPWVVRNWVTMGSPILTTTHGGYTLLLGNNVAFYFHADVMRQPWGSQQDDSQGQHQERWISSVQQRMRDEGVLDEIAADRWMSQLAWQTIREHRVIFVRMCALRAVWFWNIVPMGDARSGWPDWVVWSVGAFYAVLWIAVAIGAFDVATKLAWEWLPGLIIIASFATVHLVYWSNARMRAPLVPILALLAVRGGLIVGRCCNGRGLAGRA